MVAKQQIASHIASLLLQINAIKINVRNPFTWVSGIKSPIYCDNRQVLSYPAIRAEVATEMAFLVNSEFPACEVVAGVATGAIALGVLVAERLDKPFIYIRSAAKAHGLENKIEGRLQPGAKVVVIEDLVSTGKSSLEAVHAVRNAGGLVLGMTAIFSYELPQAKEAMEANNCMLFALSNFSSLMQQAVAEELLRPEETIILSQWRENPENYLYGKV